MLYLISHLGPLPTMLAAEADSKSGIFPSSSVSQASSANVLVLSGTSIRPAPFIM